MVLLIKHLTRPEGVRGMQVMKQFLSRSQSFVICQYEWCSFCMFCQCLAVIYSHIDAVYSGFSLPFHITDPTIAPSV